MEGLAFAGCGMWHSGRLSARIARISIALAWTEKVSRRKRKMPFYAVHKGKATGVFATWPECQEQINGFKGARFKKFESREEAEKFVVTGRKPAEEGTSADPPKAAVTRKRKAGAAEEEDKKEKKEKKVAAECEDCGGEMASVYTDGSCEGNGRTGATGGIGVFWGEGDARNLGEPLFGRQTNNRAEISAACRVLEQCREEGRKCVRICTDSQFLINCVTLWWDGWKKRGWKKSDGGEIANLEELQNLDKLKQGLHVEFRHVKGHSGIPGNEAADKLSREGAAKKRKHDNEKSE